MVEEEQMGQLALLVGDFHIPHRCAEIPIKYREMITPNKVNTVICTGNSGCRQVNDWLKSLSSTLNMVKGDFEDQSLIDLPEEKIIEFSGVKIGIIHGHQIIPWNDQETLANKAKQMNVNILIYGNSHEMKTFKFNDTIFINPGSMTGAYSITNPNSIPSFMIMEFKTTEIILYQYSLIDDELNCVDTQIAKPSK